MMELIVGKVAQIVTGQTLVINRGRTHGVQPEMEFIIQLDIPEVVDPENPTVRLSGVYYEKAKLKITKVYDKFSFASITPRASSILGFPSFETIYPPVDSRLLSDDDWKIRIGDIVRQTPKAKEDKK